MHWSVDERFLYEKRTFLVHVANPKIPVGFSWGWPKQRNRTIFLKRSGFWYSGVPPFRWSHAPNATKLVSVKRGLRVGTGSFFIPFCHPFPRSGTIQNHFLFTKYCRPKVGLYFRVAVSFAIWDNEFKMAAVLEKKGLRPRSQRGWGRWERLETRLK